MESSAGAAVDLSSSNFFAMVGLFLVNRFTLTSWALLLANRKLFDVLSKASLVL